MYDKAMCCANEYNAWCGLQRVARKENATSGPTWGSMIKIKQAST